MDYAAAVNEEIKDLFAAGADIVQIDEPWMQQHPDKARQYGLKTLDRALQGVRARSPCICALAMPPSCMTSRPAIRSWPSSKDRRRDQISIEAAQPKLDLKVLQRIAVQDHHPGRHRSVRHEGRDPADRGRPHPRARSKHVPAERIVVAPDCGMKYLPRGVAFGKMKAMVDGAADRAQRIAALSGKASCQRPALPRRSCRKPVAAAGAQRGAGEPRARRDFQRSN